VQCGIEGFQWRVGVKAILRGVTAMLGIGWLPHPRSHTFDDVSTAVFDRESVIVISSQILRSV